MDTNILLDVLAAREPFARDSARVWALAETRTIEGLVSAVSMTTVFYVTRRVASRERAMDAVRILRDVFTIAPCNARVLNQAIDSGYKDFEDAVQHFCALEAGAKWIVTRDVGHFPVAGVAVAAPATLLAAIDR